MNEAKLDQLREWGTGLAAHESPDVRATGKAILLLIEEIERLHIDLWAATTATSEHASEHLAAGLNVASADDAREADGLAQTLRERLGWRRRPPNADSTAHPQAVEDGADALDA